VGFASWAGAATWAATFCWCSLRVEHSGCVCLGQLAGYLGWLGGQTVVLELGTGSLQGADYRQRGAVGDTSSSLVVDSAAAAEALAVAVGGGSDVVPLRALIGGHRPSFHEGSWFVAAEKPSVGLMDATEGLLLNWSGQLAGCPYPSEDTRTAYRWSRPAGSLVTVGR
jgi:hypothetical protein